MSTTAITSANNLQMDYMKLLVTQLQNQSPWDPMNNNEMASQLAQFSQLEQLESMNKNFAEVLVISNRNYANSLLDKNVTFYSQDELTGTLEKKVGTVESVFNDFKTGDSLLGIEVVGTEGTEEYTLGLGAIVLVEN